MMTNAQMGVNQPERYREGGSWSRRFYFSWLAALLVATSRAATAATVIVDVGPTFNFMPDPVTIQPGDTVQWVWHGVSVTHTVTSGSKGVFDGLFNSGDHNEPHTFSFTFPNAGTFPYFCGPHYSMGMEGQVIVGQPNAPGTLGNISTRLRVETGDNALIGGFIVTGTQPKRVIVRAIGPSLPLAGVLANPTLELRDGTGALIRSNDDWRIGGQEAEIIATTIPPANDLESAIVQTLPANSSAYTAIVGGVNNQTGIAVVEAYDLDRTVDSKLANISTRGLVQTGDNVLIAGTIVLGNTAQRVIVRALGPSLPVPGAMGNPALELRDLNGALLRSNDDWRIGGQEAEIIATTIPPSNDLESALIQTLPANGASYTAIVRGVGNTTGVAVVEIYAIN